MTQLSKVLYSAVVLKTIPTAAVCLVLLCTVASAEALVQDISQAQQQSAGFAAYSHAKEMTVSGPVQKITSTRTGIYVVVVGANGNVNASLGSALPASVKHNLSVGQQVQLIGISQSRNSGQVLLVRQMGVGGASVIVRNNHGFMVHTQPHRSSTGVASTYSAAQRGAR